MTKGARAVVLLFGLVFGALALAQAVRSGAVLSEVNGQVKLQIGSDEPLLVPAGRRVPTGALLLTGAGANAILTFPDGQMVVLGENSSLRIVCYRFDPKNMKQSCVSLILVEGSARLVMGAIGQYDPSLIHIQVGATAANVVAGPEGGNRGAAGVLLEGATTMVTVTEGQVMVRLPNGQAMLLGSGDGAYVKENGAIQQGSLEQIFAQIGQTADGKQVVERLENMQSFEFALRGQRTVITLATPSMDVPVLDLPALATLTAPTTPTMAGGGSPPCGASCN